MNSPKKINGDGENANAPGLQSQGRELQKPAICLKGQVASRKGVSP